MFIFHFVLILGQILFNPKLENGITSHSCPLLFFSFSLSFLFLFIFFLFSFFFFFFFCSLFYVRIISSTSFTANMILSYVFFIHPLKKVEITYQYTFLTSYLFQTLLYIFLLFENDFVNFFHYKYKYYSKLRLSFFSSLIL